MAKTTDNLSDILNRPNVVVDVETRNPLFAAVSAMMAEVHGLVKDENNKHGGYKYVSVDSFKEMLRPLMAKHGLSLMMTEEAFELTAVQNSQGKDTATARITYAMQLRHVSGEREDIEKATIMLPYTGAQTAGAARSYVLKEYLKGRFMVATGDKDVIEGGADADAYKQQDYSAPAAKTAHAARKAELDKDYMRIEQGLHTIEKTGSMEDLALFWKANQAPLRQMPAEWVATLSRQKDELKAVFDKAARMADARMAGANPDTGEIDPPEVEPDMSGDR